MSASRRAEGPAAESQSRAPLRRIVILGPGGAGKSTLARALGARLGLPVIHLDAHYWHAGWVPTPDAEWRRTVGALVARDAWVMDGNFGGTIDARLAACDTAILLDPSPLGCLWRVVQRRIRHAGGTRPDMAAGCDEKLDVAFLWWIASYRWRRRPAVRRRLAQLRGDQRVVVLRSMREITAFGASGV